MISNDQKTSLLIPSQLPEYIRDNPDYGNFVSFLQAYYEWMEQNGNATDRAKNLLNYTDIDATSSEFLKYYVNDFLPYFPEDALVSKQKAIKFAKQLYTSKGTPESFKFLFRVLYNSDFDYYYTSDSVLRASDGDWYTAKSLRLATTDVRFLSINNYRIFGETSKSIATIENVILTGTKVEVFISNIERLFQSGEFVRIVDNNNQDVIINGTNLRAKLVGQISAITVDPNNRGQFYNPGDPVIVYNGLSSSNGVGATAEVGSVTKGSIKNILVTTGGLGYTQSNTIIQISNAPGASAVVSSVIPYANTIANVSFVPSDTIAPKTAITIGANNYHFNALANTNANTTLANALTFLSFTTYPLSSILVTNGGGGINASPQISAISQYQTDVGNADLASLGILGPIQITNGGLGYQTNDTILVIGGSGEGATANVTSVAANGQILNVGYTSNGKYPPGGMGYKNSSLPTLRVNSANVQATGASLYVPGILGKGATFSVTTDRIGTVSSINVTNPGEDYVATPNVSLRVQDIVVSNVAYGNLPQQGEIAYQGNTTITATYTANVAGIIQLTHNNDVTKNLYVLRVYNYSSKPLPNKVIKFSKSTETFNVANIQFDSSYDINGIKNYGDGRAQATASFLNGLTVSGGQYLSSKGQPSSYSVLESQNYNNYTYQITVGKEIEKYRNILLNLLHPSGMKVIGRYAMLSSNNYTSSAAHGVQQGHTLQYYTGYIGSGVKMVADFTNHSNNVVQFTNIGNIPLSTFIYAGVVGTQNTIIRITSTNGPNVESEVISVNNAANTITLRESVWLTYQNVAIVQANSGGTQINVQSLTNSYNLVNNGHYTDPNYPLKDIVKIGDIIKINSNNPNTVTNVNYQNNVISVANTINTTVTSYLSVNRTLVATDGGVRFYGAVGVQYIPELATEDNNILTDESGNILIIG